MKTAESSRLCVFRYLFLEGCEIFAAEGLLACSVEELVVVPVEDNSEAVLLSKNRFAVRLT